MDGHDAAPGGLSASLRLVFSRPALRRVQLALAGSSIGDWAYTTAVIVWAYEVAGSALVGAWIAGRYLLMALFSPAVAALADRFDRRAVMVGSDLLRALLVAGAAVSLLAGAAAWAVLALATASSVVGTAFRPAQLALMPVLVERPAQLTAANSVASTFDSLAFFVGPALAGLLLTVTDVATVFWLNVLTFLWSALLVARTRGTGAAPSQPGRSTRPRVDTERPAAMLLAGFRVVRHDRDLVMVLALMAVQSFVVGAEYVFAVSVAVEVLGTGPEGLGFLEAVLGAGALVGGLVVIARSGRAALGRGLYVGVLLWSLPVAVIAAAPLPWVAFAAMSVIGFANPFVDVNYATLLQRLAPDRALGRVFGVTEMVVVLAMALGAIATPALIEGQGLRAALLVVGVGPLLLALPWWWRVRRLDARLVEPAGLPVLRSVDLFQPLSPVLLESLSRQLQRREVAQGEVLVEQGTEADRFFVLESGRVAVTQDGRLLRHQGPGEYFGEIGLLRGVPRTATVTVTEPGVVHCLSRADFLGAVTGDDEATGLAADVVARRLGG